MGDRDIVKQILAAGTFERLVGMVETDWLEFKGGLYNLDQEFQQHELAKDVAAIANADGGFLLIGVRTRLDDEHESEVVCDVTLITREFCNPVRYRDVIIARTYPPLSDVEVSWQPSYLSGNKGLLVITVPQAIERNPILVRKIAEDTGKTHQTVFGYYERRRTSAAHYEIQQLHAMIKDGRRFNALQAEIANVADSVIRLTEELHSIPTRDLESQSPNQIEVAKDARGAADTLANDSRLQNQYGPSTNDVQSRIEALLRAADLEEHPSIAFGAAPTCATGVRSLAVSTSEAIQLLRNPPLRRRGGFGLGSYDSVPLAHGGRQRRGLRPGFKAIELWRDGVFLFAATGDQEFLGWHHAPAAEGSFIINTLVIAEVSYLFCETYQKLLPLMGPRPTTTRYFLELRRLDAPGTPPCIRPEKVLQFPAYTTPLVSAPSGGERFAFEACTDDAPELTGFGFLRELFVWFGIEEDQIPYTQYEPASSRIIIGDLK